ncbi:hypothetical protein E4U53_007073 [Claviceps sorghi]|nr:hypothetical protein E4U53_007073 [Claviceps sorghi]
MALAASRVACCERLEEAIAVDLRGEKAKIAFGAEAIVLQPIGHSIILRQDGQSPHSLPLLGKAEADKETRSNALRDVPTSDLPMAP